MKNLIKTVAIMIVMATKTTTINAQFSPILPVKEAEIDLIKPSSDGKYYMNSSFLDYSNKFSLRQFTNASYTTGTHIRDIMKVTMYHWVRKSQKWFLVMHIVAYPGIDTLQPRIRGSITFSSSASNAGNFLTKSFDGSNNTNYTSINTNDGTWGEIVFNEGPFAGVTGYKFKQIIWSMDSISQNSCDANGLFYFKQDLELDCQRYSVGSAPYIATYWTDGTYNAPFKMDLPYLGRVGTKKVDASFSTASFTRGSDASSLTVGTKYFPTNYNDSISCKKLVGKLFKKEGNILISPKTINPYQDEVDQENTGESRRDKLSEWITWNNLLDTTAYVFKAYEKSIDNVETLVYSEEILTKKLYGEPSMDNIVVSEETHNTAKVTLTYYLGNINATPLEISVLGASGSMFTRSFNTAGIPGTLVTEVFTVTGLVPNTAYAVHPKKDGIFIKPIVKFTTLPEPIVITTFDPISWSIESVSFNADSSLATYTVTCTPGNDGMKIYILATDNYGVAAELEFDPKVTKTVSVPGYKKGQDRTMKIHTRTNTGSGIVDVLKGTFMVKSATASGGGGSGGSGGGTDTTSGISNVTAADLNLSAFPNPFTNTLSISGKLEKGIEMKLSDLMGRVVSSTTEKILVTESLPAGIYFLRVNHQVIKVEKK